MRLAKQIPPMAEGDMTPMIDMTFQLIAFFMVLINFSEAEQDQRIKLPSSELAKPPDKAYTAHRTLQLTKSGTVVFGGDEVPVDGLEVLLQREKILLERQKKDLSDVTIIVRADSAAKTGKVQDMIQVCQKVGFDQFSLHAKQTAAGQ